VVVLMVGKVIAAQAVHEVGDIATYHCDSLRLMQLANIDPSLAIGFYCRSPGEPSFLM